MKHSRRYGLAALAAGLGVAALIQLGTADGNDAFAVFKDNLVETACVVPRIGTTPRYGDTRIGAGGGAELSDEEAREAHACALEAMRQGYAASRLAEARDYAGWSVFSTGPYSSEDHHDRYVSNFANAIAAENYALYEASVEFPVGSLLAKDSLVVSESGRVLFGALSLMEKMPAGFNPDGGNWRYTLVLPDGRLFGRTGTGDAYAVEFCQECHAHSAQDFVFFLPRQYRISR